YRLLRRRCWMGSVRVLDGRAARARSCAGCFVLGLWPCYGLDAKPRSAPSAIEGHNRLCGARANRASRMGSWCRGSSLARLGRHTQNQGAILASGPCSSRDLAFLHPALSTLIGRLGGAERLDFGSSRGEREASSKTRPISAPRARSSVGKQV